MTNPTPHGQVPEALRLADALERPGYGWHTTPAQCAAVLRRLHAENEALRTQQPEPDGAPPGAYVNGAGIKADDRPSTVIRKLNARFHDLVTFPRAEKFAASPTPPAEQQAPSAAAADTVVLEAALRAIHQAIDLIGEPDTERLRTVRRVLRGAVIVAEDAGEAATAPQPAPAPVSESEYKRGYRDGYDRRDAEVQGALV